VSSIFIVSMAGDEGLRKEEQPASRNLLTCAAFVVVFCVVCLAVNMGLYYSVYKDSQAYRDTAHRVFDAEQRLSDMNAVVTAATQQGNVSEAAKLAVVEEIKEIENEEEKLKALKAGSNKAPQSSAEQPSENVAAAVNPFGNIIRIETMFSTYSQEMPWSIMQSTFQDGLEQSAGATASGLILEKGLILTSGYVATDAMLISAVRQGDGKRYPMKVVAVADDLDLALLTCEDEGFWLKSDVSIVPRSGAHLTALEKKVLVAGFGTGNVLSIVKLESRISGFEVLAGGEPGRYRALPTTVMSLYPEIGSSISVGPVFSADTEASLVGFISKSGLVVPAKTVANFVSAVAHFKQWPGVGTLGLVIRPMLPPDMRKYWDLPEDDIGVQIRTVEPESEFQKKGVKKGDFLMAIDGQAVRAQGVIEYNATDETRVSLPFGVLLAEKFPNTSSKFTFRRPQALDPKDQSGRQGYGHSTEYQVDVTLGKLHSLSERVLDKKPMEEPPYIMVGGLIFGVFSEELLVQNAKTQDLEIPAAVQAQVMHRWRQDKDEEVVIMLRGLDHACNKFYGGMQTVRIVKTVNDHSVKNLEDFIKRIGTELKNNATSLRFVFYSLDDDDAAGGKDDPDIVLNTTLCAGADADLAQSLGIPMPVNQDLAKTYVANIPREFFAGPQAAMTPEAAAAGDLEEDDSQGVWLSKNRPSAKTEKGVIVTGADGHQERVAKSKKETTKHNKAVNGEDSNYAVATSELPWANVVQINLISSDIDYLNPWRTGPEEGARCSAIIVDVEARLILTNSHCVAGAKSLDVLREEEPVPVPARVVEIAHDVDLAWVTTDSDKFWKSRNFVPKVPMSAGLPYLSALVRVIGFPIGGTSVTITKGIVSRLDGQLYPNGLMEGARNTPNKLLIVQVDAAINHGNSGGPVFDTEGRLLGLAFAGLDGANSVGYVIPNVYMRNFVDSVLHSKENRWVAQPEIGALFRPVANPGLRNYWRLADNETGVQVRSISPYSPIHGKVEKGDVLMKIDGHTVQGNGKVSWEFPFDKQRGRAARVEFPFDVNVTKKAFGDTTAMQWLRVNVSTGKRHKFTTTTVFKPIPPLVARFDDAPAPVTGRDFFAAANSYFISYGLVWGVFSIPVLRQAFDNVPWSVLKYALHRWRKDKEEEVVVLLTSLQHRCTLYYDTSMMRALDSFNGRKVKNMKDLVRRFSQAESDQQEEYMRFTFTPLSSADEAGSSVDPDIVLSKTQCQGADRQLMTQMNIPSPVSADLQQTFDESQPDMGARKIEITPQELEQLIASQGGDLKKLLGGDGALPSSPGASGGGGHASSILETASSNIGYSRIQPAGRQHAARLKDALQLNAAGRAMKARRHVATPGAALPVPSTATYDAVVAEPMARDSRRTRRWLGVNSVKTSGAAGRQRYRRVGLSEARREALILREMSA